MSQGLPRVGVIVHEAVELLAEYQEERERELTDEPPEGEEDDSPHDAPTGVVVAPCFDSLIDGDCKNNQRDDDTNYGDHGSSRI